MARQLAVTPSLTGEPVTLGADVSTSCELLRALDLPPVEAPAVLALGPRIALIHSLTGRAPTVAIRLVRLPHTPRLDGVGPVEGAIVLTAPLPESGVALRLISRLMAGLRDQAMAARLVAATTREEAVRVLSPLDETSAETPLAGDQLLTLLASNPQGLSSIEAARRMELCGPNRIERVQRRSLIARLLDQFISFFAVLLWIGGALALLAGMPELGWVIFAVIVVNGLFSFFQEYRAERAVDALQQLLPREVAVLRGGDERRLPGTTLVPGDVMRLEDGDQVSADGQLLSADGLRVDQSALTGESQPAFKMPMVANERQHVPRLERHELVFAGTGVVAGRATCVVTATGMRTEIGGIARLTQAVLEEPSPLQREMVQMTRIVTFLAVTVGLGFFLLGVGTGVLSIAEGFLFALGVVVANVPEGLLPTLTLALALAVGRMARAGSLIKRLSAVDALGATTVICTDKTGTVTHGRMTARALVVGGRVVPAEALTPDASDDVRELLAAAALASVATLEHGDPTEVALVAAAAHAGLDTDKLRRAHEVCAAHPFDSFRKRMTLVRAVNGDAIAYVKGAPRETLALCETMRCGGATVGLTDEIRGAVLDQHDRLAGEGLRMLAVATRVLPTRIEGTVTTVERELTLLGIVALWDPPRAEVESAIRACHSGGIRVIMVTGDYGLTAAAIARQIQLPVAKVVTGDEIDRMAPTALRAIVREPGVLFARTSPAHKLAIVMALKDEGEVVAVTGDGVNDAPALKAAAIGVAMGRRGSEVAKEAAEMVVTDDDFAAIVAAIRQGRAIYANMGKFVTYIFTHNFAELAAFLAFVFIRIPLPLTVMQVLAVDLATDMFPALALGAEPPEPGVMERPPRSPTDRLLSAGRLARAYGFLGVIEAALALAAFFWTYRVAGWRPGLPMAASGELYRRATTMTLAGIVATQVGNVFACRTDRESVFRVGLLTNGLVLTGIAAELVILLALMLLPPLPYLFGLEPLAFTEWGILLVFPPTILLLEEGRKWMTRRTRSRPGGWAQKRR